MLQKIQTDVDDPEAREFLENLLKSDLKPALSELYQVDLSPEMMEQLENYFIARDHSVADLWGDLRKIINRLESRLDSRVFNQLISLIDRATVDQMQGGQFESETPKEETSEERSLEMVKAALKNKNFSRLSSLSGLPENIVESFSELYLPPEETNKWQTKLFSLYRRIVYSFFYRQEATLDEVKQFVNKFREIINIPTPLMKLIIQPPQPDAYLLTHSFNTSLVACLLADREFEFDDTQMNFIILASAGADLGLTFVPQSLFLKDTTLSNRGKSELSKHPLYSEKLAARALGSMHPVVALVGQHQERRDGAGYPRGLSAEKQHRLLPPLVCADVYTAYLEDRPYRDAKFPDEALDNILAEKEKYHPRCLRALKEQVGYYPEPTPVLLDDNRLAVVKNHRPDTPKKPDVWVITDSKHNKLDNFESCSLAKETGLGVKKVVRSP